MTINVQRNCTASEDEDPSFFERVNKEVNIMGLEEGQHGTERNPT